MTTLGSGTAAVTAKTLSPSEVDEDDIALQSVLDQSRSELDQVHACNSIQGSTLTCLKLQLHRHSCRTLSQVRRQPQSRAWLGPCFDTPEGTEKVIKK